MIDLSYGNMTLMGAREKLENRIEQKRRELAKLKGEMRDTEVFIAALEEVLGLLPKENAFESAMALRPGTNVDKARIALAAKGRPMHVSELLLALSKSDDNDSRAALSGSISAYVRKNQIFTRPAPNTFGLIEFSARSAATQRSSTPPANFGSDAMVQPEAVEEDVIWPIPEEDNDTPF